MAITRKIPGSVLNIIDHGESVYTIEISTDQKVPRFLPGQFLHLAIDPYDPSDYWPDSRAFSIASSPNQNNFLRITYSVKGSFTSRMENELIKGKKIWVKLPYGKFIISKSSPAVLIAGGTGITAFVAYLSDYVRSMRHKILLLYGARNPQLLVYKDKIDEVQKSNNNLIVHYFIDSEEPLMSFPKDKYTLGKISIEHVNKLFDIQVQTNYYLAGPPNMITSIKTGLLKRKISSESIHIDDWE